MSFNYNDILTPQVTITGIAPTLDQNDNVTNNNPAYLAISNIISTPLLDFNNSSGSMARNVVSQWLSTFNKFNLSTISNLITLPWGRNFPTDINAFLSTDPNSLVNYWNSRFTFPWGSVSFSSPNIPLAVSAIQQQFLNFIAPDGTQSSSSADATLWSQLIASGGPSATQQAENAFEYFLRNYPYQSGLLGANTANAIANWTGNVLDLDEFSTNYTDAGITDFFTAWYNFLKFEATLDSATATPSSGPTTTTGTGSPLSFRQAYENLGYPAAGFQSALEQFYHEELARTGNGNEANGFFIPTQSFSAWQSKLVADRNQILIDGLKDALDGVPEVFGKVTVDTDPEKKLLVIDDILILLIKMINIIYRVSAAQSETLQFYSLWQEKYTNLIQRIPVLLSNGNPIAGGDSNSGQVRGRQEVQSFNQGLNEHIQSRRSALQDNAKSLQANINQSQDAANQQANIATSILQDLSSILSAIYR